MSENVRKCPIGAGSESDTPPAGLSATQLEAVRMLQNGWPLRMVSQKLDVSVRTLFRWRQLPAMAAELDRRKREAWSYAREVVQELVPLAMQVLEDGMFSDDQRARLQAASTVLKLTGAQQALKEEG